MNPLEGYEDVDSRLHRFWTAYRDHAAVTTELLEVHRAADGTPLQYITRATITVDGATVATGLAEENVNSSRVNRTSALENCETSAVGRALANAGFSPRGARPSREEMVKASGATGDLDLEGAVDLAAETLGATVVEARPFATPTVAGASDKQLKFAASLTRRLGLDPTAALEVARTVTGNADLSSARDMTPREASAYIDELQRRLDNPTVAETNPWAVDNGGPTF